MPIEIINNKCIKYMFINKLSVKYGGCFFIKTRFLQNILYSMIKKIEMA